MNWAQLIAALAACGGLRTGAAVDAALREAAATPEAIALLTLLATAVTACGCAPSCGFANKFFRLSDMVKFMLIFFGGIGLMNHLL